MLMVSQPGNNDGWSSALQMALNTGDGIVVYTGNSTKLYEDMITAWRDWLN